MEFINGVRVKDRTKKLESRVKKGKFFRQGNKALPSWYWNIVVLKNYERTRDKETS